MQKDFSVAVALHALRISKIFFSRGTFSFLIKA
jgi:hypothetical protein